MNENEQRIARAEALFRDVNERIAESAQRFESEEAAFVCECAETDHVLRKRALAPSIGPTPLSIGFERDAADRMKLPRKCARGRSRRFEGSHA